VSTDGWDDDRPEHDPPDAIHWIGLEPASEEIEDKVEVATVSCWRCGKLVAQTMVVCRYCRARLVREKTPEPRHRDGSRGHPDESSSVMVMIYIYISLLASSVIVGWINGFGLGVNVLPGANDDYRRLTIIIVIGLIDGLLVVAGILWCKQPPTFTPILGAQKGLAWVGAVPLLAVLLLANYGYMSILRTGLRVPVIPLGMAKRPELFYWVLLALCLLPAIVEELFFRYLALGHLRTVLSSHGAVIVSGVMFGLAHIGNPFAIPYLIVFGIGLGYFRVAGRSLAIPMLMHFAHNAIVIWSEPWL